MSQQSMELTQVILGLTPYVLIEREEDPDDPGEPLLKLKAGGGAAEEPFALLALALSGTAPEGNPVAEMLQRLAGEMTGSVTGPLTVIDRITREFNPGWIPFVMGDDWD